MKKVLENRPCAIVCLLLSAAVSFGQTSWIPYAGNPVADSTLDPTAASIYDPMILLDGSTYKMWYTRENGEEDPENIGYATSPDGITWTSADTAALLPSGGNTRFDATKVGQGTVIKDGGTYKMWYWGNGPNIGNIGYATSPNGTVWTKVDGANADKSVYSRAEDGSGALALVTPSVVKTGDTYHMWYTRYLVSGWRIAYATSTDGIAWTNVPGSGSGGAVIDLGGSGTFESDLVGFPCVLATSEGFEMWYAGNNGSVTSIGYATSSDGITWVKSGSCLTDAGTAAVIKEDSVYKMWYASDAGLNYATTSGSGIENGSALENGLELMQNNPNPFNPKTTIRFSLPQATTAKLVVYNSKGELITTLINGFISAGRHSVDFDASGLNSGVYFCKLQANGGSSVSKMMLTK